MALGFLTGTGCHPVADRVWCLLHKKGLKTSFEFSTAELLVTTAATRPRCPASPAADGPVPGPCRRLRAAAVQVAAHSHAAPTEGTRPGVTPPQTKCYLRNKDQVESFWQRRQFCPCPPRGWERTQRRPGAGSIPSRPRASPCAGLCVAILWMSHSCALRSSQVFLVHVYTPRRGKKQMQRYKRFCSRLREEACAGQGGEQGPPPHLWLTAAHSPHLGCYPAPSDPAVLPQRDAERVSKTGCSPGLYRALQGAASPRSSRDKLLQNG